MPSLALCLVESPGCTDPITRKALQRIFQRAKTIVNTVYIVLSILALLIVATAAWFDWTSMHYTFGEELVRRANGYPYIKVFLEPRNVSPALNAIINGSTHVHPVTTTTVAAAPVAGAAAGTGGATDPPNYYDWVAAQEKPPLWPLVS